MHPVSISAAVRYAEDRMQKIGLIASKRMLLDLYCLLPGQSQRIHSHEGSDKIYVVLEGRAAIQIGGEDREIREGAAVLAPAGEPHGVANRSREPLALLVCVAPPAPHAGEPGERK